MSAAWTTEAVTRFRDILALVSREQVRTAYEIAVKLKLPVSSTYLTVAEMERLSCLARDESGYLLVGIRPQQMALDALGFQVAAQRLAPLVRHLRDQSGETVFMASMAEFVTVGTVAMGFNPGHLVVQPFQTYRYAASPPPADMARAGVFEVTLATNAQYGDYGALVNLMALHLARSTSSAHPATLAVGVARPEGQFRDAAHLARKLLELKAFFDSPG